MAVHKCTLKSKVLKRIGLRPGPGRTADQALLDVKNQQVQAKHVVVLQKDMGRPHNGNGQGGNWA